MARHRAPDWVPEKLQHLGWATLLCLGVAAALCVAVGFVCCVGWRIGG